VFGAAVAEVVLADMPIREGDDRRFVSLAEIWIAAGLRPNVVDPLFCLVGDDGFDTATKPLPRRPPLLREGFVERETRDVSWMVDVPCFYRVKALSLVKAMP
jgi:hypothetical protein